MLACTEASVVLSLFLAYRRQESDEFETRTGQCGYELECETRGDTCATTLPGLRYIKCHCEKR